MVGSLDEYSSCSQGKAFSTRFENWGLRFFISHTHTHTQTHTPCARLCVCMCVCMCVCGRGGGGAMFMIKAIL